MLRELFALTIEASTYQWSGKLAVTNSVADLEWQLFFEMGRLVWIDGGVHPRRRYRRYFKSLGISPKRSNCTTPEARSQFAIAAIRSQRIDVEGLQEFLQNGAREVFFDISQACSSSLDRSDHGDFGWEKNMRPSKEFILPSSWGIDVCPAFKRGRRDWRQWGERGLSYQSPDMSLKILDEDKLAAMLSPKSLGRAKKLFSGKHSLRDIAALKQQDIGAATSSIRKLLRKGCLSLEACPDYGARKVPVALSYLAANGADTAAMALKRAEELMTASVADKALKGINTIEATETVEIANPAAAFRVQKETPTEAQFPVAERDNKPAEVRSTDDALESDPRATGELMVAVPMHC
ncbi:MAG: hypothetical protein AAFY11_00840 [Cyanobacteria bacterium J06641_5]